jgi:DNA-binding phage protein
MKYKSVIDFEIAEFIENSEEKKKYLNIIIRQQGKGNSDFLNKQLETVEAIEINILEICCKVSGI